MGAVDHSAQFRRKGLTLSISSMFVHMPIVAKKCTGRALNIVRKYICRSVPFMDDTAVSIEELATEIMQCFGVHRNYLRESAMFDLYASIAA
jgi:regulator of PEP synthase PpsR (kinase-PPPase family)